MLRRWIRLFGLAGTKRTRLPRAALRVEKLEDRSLMAVLGEDIFPDGTASDPLAADSLVADYSGQLSPTSTPGEIYSYKNPPALPPSAPTSTVSVSTVNGLISAVGNLQSGQTISIAAGTYDLTGLTSALYIPQNISNWSVRGATGSRDDVVIKGAGMSGSVNYGFWIGQSPGGTIANLTIDGVKTHGIIANAGTHSLLVHNVRIIDSGDQSVKSSSNPNGAGNTGGIVQYSVFEYRTTDNNNYTNGVDVHEGDGWIVRYNLFKNFLSPAGQGLAGPAVLMWNGTKNTVVEGNTFINCARGISLGLIDKADGFDHEGGVIQNNFFYRDANLSQQVDVPIYVGDSPNTKVYHNTTIVQGSYPYAIEYRFASTTGTDIKNNLTDGGYRARDGAVGSLGGNIATATLSMFVSPATGDLHLVAGASPINRGVGITGFTTDIDAQIRDSQLDVGADEFITESVPDTTSPTISGVATSNLSDSGLTIAWNTNEAADTQVEYGTSSSYGSASSLETSLVTSHSVGLTGLAANTTYHFRVRSRDAAGNLALSSDSTFTTSVDSTSPIISDVTTSNLGKKFVTVAWFTNEPSNTQVEYGTSTIYGSTTALNTALVTSHSVKLSGLAAGTTYHFRVRSRDAAGNLAVSGDFTFTTAGGPRLAAASSLNESTEGSANVRAAPTLEDDFGMTAAMVSVLELEPSRSKFWGGASRR